MQNNYLNHKKIYKLKEKITHFEFTRGRIGSATVAGNCERGARYSPEQSHAAAVQRLSPSGGCGGPWRSGATEARRRARVHGKEGATRGSVTVARRRPQRRSDGGATEAATRAGRWRDSGCFIFDSGATVAASFLPAVRWRSKTGDPIFVDGGAIGDGEGES